VCRVLYIPGGVYLPMYTRWYTRLCTPGGIPGYATRCVYARLATRCVYARLATRCVYPARLPGVFLMHFLLVFYAQFLLVLSSVSARFARKTGLTLSSRYSLGCLRLYPMLDSYCPFLARKVVLKAQGRGGSARCNTVNNGE